MLWCEAYDGGLLTDIEYGFDVLGLASSGAGGNPNGEPSCDTGDNVSVADWGGVKVKPPKAGLMPVGEMWESSGPRRRVSMLSGRIMFPSGYPGVYDPGEVSGVPSP